jgi:hypothetical protein
MTDFWTVDWDGGFVVGGEAGTRLTPNFRLREFRRADGTVRVHRELVTALQMLRDRLGKSLSVTGVDADGLGAAISAGSLAELMRAADALSPQQLFESVAESGGGVRVRIPSPDGGREIELAQALEAAFNVTAGFETSGDKFQQITGNFDRAGLSFGPAQVNFRSGTLVPLFRKFQAEDEAALRACFSDPDDYEEWLKVLDLPVAQQIAWANRVSTGRNNGDVIQPWKGYFRAVGRVPAFRMIMVASILKDYGAKLLVAVAHLRKLRPDIQIDHLRCVCSLWDLVIQQGSLDRAANEIAERVKRENPRDQFHLVRIAVEERAKKASPEFVDDCMSRRVGVLKGVPETVGGRQRANILFYLLRDARVRDASAIPASEVEPAIARASAAIAGAVTA